MSRMDSTGVILQQGNRLQICPNVHWPSTGQDHLEAADDEKEAEQQTWAIHAESPDAWGMMRAGATNVLKTRTRAIATRTSAYPMGQIYYRVLSVNLQRCRSASGEAS